METSTQANSDLRELTKTEIEIAYAQIIDRMTRAIKAANDMLKLQEKQDGWYDEDFNQVREKYDIPQGVYIFMDESMELMSLKDKSVKDLVKHWVSGELSDIECTHAIFWMDELDEIDWGWAFMEQPINFYKADKAGEYWSHQEARVEFRKIGTRKNKPHRKAKFKAYPNCSDIVASIGGDM
jgi:hypothetical protein